MVYIWYLQAVDAGYAQGVFCKLSTPWMHMVFFASLLHGICARFFFASHLHGICTWYFCKPSTQDMHNTWCFLQAVYMGYAHGVCCMSSTRNMHMVDFCKPSTRDMHMMFSSCVHGICTWCLQAIYTGYAHDVFCKLSTRDMQLVLANPVHRICTWCFQAVYTGYAYGVFKPSTQDMHMVFTSHLHGICTWCFQAFVEGVPSTR
jgi:hypothetical protein